MVLVLYFLIVVALPAALGLYVVFNGLERSRRCPCCAEDTVALCSRWRRAATRALRSEELQLRWCMACGWSGSARLRRYPPAGLHRGGIVGPERSGSRRRADRVDVRRLQVDGRAWQVMVQCWADEGHWVGRLVFIGTDGRECGEEGPSIEGRSAIEVLSRALAIPEGALAGRLRRAIH